MEHTIITVDTQRTFDRVVSNEIMYSYTARTIPTVCGVNGCTCQRMFKNSKVNMEDCEKCPLAMFAKSMIDIQYRLFVWASEEIRNSWRNDEDVFVKLRRIEEYVTINKENHDKLVDYCHYLLED